AARSTNGIGSKPATPDQNEKRSTTFVARDRRSPSATVPAFERDGATFPGSGVPARDARTVSVAGFFAVGRIAFVSFFLFIAHAAACRPVRSSISAAIAAISRAAAPDGSISVGLAHHYAAPAEMIRV